MTELLTAAGMRAIEREAIEAGRVTGIELMERAGRGVVEAMLDWRPELGQAPHRAVVLCGPGNNGGDGFVVARLLKQRGWEVEVYLYGRDPAEVDRLPPDAAASARRWRDGGGDVAAAVPGMLTDRAADVRIDAVFGTGLTRPIRDDLDTMLGRTGRPGGNPGSVVAVDAPSGLCMDSGRALGRTARAGASDLTVTFHGAKIGHFLGDGPALCGALRVADIGLPALRPRSRGGVERVDAACCADLPGVAKRGGGHKYDHGHALVLSGGPAKGGAARLAARGALRIGAGLVTVGCPPAALQENAAGLDAVMLAALPDVAALAEFGAARKVKAVCIGPGFGHGERLRAFVAAVLGGVEPRSAQEGGRGAHPTGVVLDADALSEYADDPGTLFAMLHEACVLTPHTGELGRLFPDILAKLTAPVNRGPAFSKIDAAREAAARAGCVVLFKGPDTVIADPSGRCAMSSAAYERAAPWLATAGSGDVLAGLITGLLARGFGAFEAAEAGAWLHVECALRFGPGLIAEDLPEQLPAVFGKLGL